jgi:predicted enzyme related to lactoylglutathione lyase
MRRLWTAVAALALASTSLVIGQVAPWAQNAVPPGEVIGPGNFIHVVGDVERSVAFYQDVVGMNLQRAAGRGAAQPPAPPPTPAPRPFGGQPEIMRLYNAVDTPYRIGTIMVGDWPMRAEQIEFKGDGHKPAQPRVQDPGASMLVLTVRDLDAVMARVRKNGAPIVTTGGAPVTLTEDGNRMRAIMLRDPDGFYVELLERASASVPAASASDDGNIVGVSFAATVSTEKTQQVFRDALGFDTKVGSFASDKGRLDLMGTPGAEYRRTTATVPGSSFQYEFFEFRRIDTKPAKSTTIDPGTAVLRIRVRDMDSTLARLSKAGVRVWSAGGEPVTVGQGNTQRFAITTGLDNVYIQVVQQVARVQ